MIELWEQELHSFSQNLSDRQLALRTSNAIATDQHIIADLQQQDVLCSRDRALALSLSEVEDESQNDLPHQAEQTSDDAQVEAIRDVMSSLAQVSVSEDVGSTSDLSNSTGRCVSCFDTLGAPPLFLPSCGHEYCRKCLREMFLAATKDEELYPPRCCKQVFPPGTALRLLSYQELAAFSSKGVEFNCSSRIYCGDPTCSVFIPPWKIDNEEAKCPACALTTHAICKTLFSEGHECPSDEALQQVLNLGEDEHWRRCPQCRTLIELGQGCNHITCR